MIATKLNTNLTGAASLEGNKPPVFPEGVGQVVNTQPHALSKFNHKMDAVWGFLRKMEKNEEQLASGLEKINEDSAN